MKLQRQEVGTKSFTLWLHFHCHLNLSTIQGRSAFVNPKSVGQGIEVIKLEHNLKLKIKRNDWLLADTCPCPQAANHYALLEGKMFMWVIIKFVLSYMRISNTKNVYLNS